MSDFKMNLNVQDLATKLGDNLVGRLKGYLKDDFDTEFIKEMALEMAELQFQAAMATTRTLRDAAETDIKFTHARIQTFVARNALKFKSEAKDTVNEIIQTVGGVLGTIARAALTGVAG